MRVFSDAAGFSFLSESLDRSILMQGRIDPTMPYIWVSFAWNQLICWFVMYLSHAFVFRASQQGIYSAQFICSNFDIREEWCVVVTISSNSYLFFTRAHRNPLWLPFLLPLTYLEDQPLLRQTPSLGDLLLQQIPSPSLKDLQLLWTCGSATFVLWFLTVFVRSNWTWTILAQMSYLSSPRAVRL